MLLIIIIYCYIIFGFSFSTNKLVQTPYFNEYWMSYIDPKTIITNLVLPGTHDSLANTVANIYNTDDSLAKILSKYKWLPGIKHKVTRWSRTQINDIDKQLSRGIRFFDFRISYTNQDKKCHGVHTFIFSEISTTIDKLDRWLSIHPKEIIIIKYRSDSPICDDIFRRKLGKWILPTKYDPFQMTLSDLYNLNYRLILTTDIKLKNDVFSDIIHPDIVYHDWKNTFSMEEKEDYITNSLNNWDSKENKLFNLDWTLTPQTTDIIINNSSLLSYATNMNDKLDNFIKNLDNNKKTKIKLISVDNENSIDLVKIIFDNNLNKFTQVNNIH